MVVFFRVLFFLRVSLGTEGPGPQGGPGPMGPAPWALYMALGPWVVYMQVFRPYYSLMWLYDSLVCPYYSLVFGWMWGGHITATQSILDFRSGPSRTSGPIGSGVSKCRSDKGHTRE